jgi:hypothetical protein
MIDHVPWRREQPALEPPVVHPFRHRPGNADHGSPPQILADRRSADADGDGDMPFTHAKSCRSLRTSRTFRIGTLSAGIGAPRAWPQRGAGPRFDRRLRELQAGLTTGWPAMGGRLPSESVAGLRRNQWPASGGIRSTDRRTEASFREHLWRRKPLRVS